MKKYSWLWWLSGEAKDAEDKSAVKIRRQTDRAAEQQDAQRERAEKVEQKTG